MTLFVKFVFCCCVLGSLQLCISSQQLTKCLKTPNGWHVNNTAYSTEVASSALECALLCYSDVNCTVVNYDEQSGICDRYNGVWFDVNDTPMTKSITFVRQIEVIMLIKVDLYRSLTFSQATAECNNIGGRITTPAEMMTLFENGYEKCNCGYLSDGSIRFPMQKVVVGAGCMDRVGIINCGWLLGKNADAFCSVSCNVDQMDETRRPIIEKYTKIFDELVRATAKTIAKEKTEALENMKLELASEKNTVNAAVKHLTLAI